MKARLLAGLGVGVGAGVLSGLVGVGGGIVIVPILVYLFKMDQHTAQGTSLTVLLPPTGLFAFLEYYKAGHVEVGMAIMIALGVLLGGYFGGGMAQQLPAPVLRKIFAVVLALAGVKMFFQR